MSEEYKTLVWHKVLSKDELPEGRVTSVTCKKQTLCMSHHEGQYGALDNKCPHQGGPLGEGSIENGLLRCPWHGWDYDPITGKAPGFDDGVETFPVEIRDDGIYVGLTIDQTHVDTVGDLMMETLTNWGVKQVFGMVGHSNLGVADALRIQEQAGRLTYYGIRHEGAAAFACSAYGKLTGRPAACLAIAGPGATNLLTGLWDANVDRAPVIALTGQVDTQVLGPGAFQEIDQVGAFGKVAQWSQTVMHDSRHTELMNLACKSAILNRSVSHLIFPDEVPKRELTDPPPAGTPEGRLPSRNIAPATEALQAAVDLLRVSKRPVIVVGHGARFQMGGVTALAEHLNAPVITTFKAKGQIADNHPLAGGVLGRSGTPIASWLMNESDCLLVFGASFSNHTGITPKRPTIQVDYDLMTLAKFHAIDVPVWGEIGVTAQALSAALTDYHDTKDQRDEVAERWAIWREEKKRRAQDDRGKGINAAILFEKLGQAVDPDAIIAVDVGNNTYSFGRYFECQHQAVLMSGYLGSIGFSFPAAMGAWSATQEEDPQFKGRQVVSVSGDGGFGQYLAEINTAVKYGMNITHVLMNNCELGKISKEQRAGNWEVWQTSLHNPNFAEYAELCGALGIRVTDSANLGAALKKALSHPGPALVEVLTDVELV
ncbi:MAG: Rieske 2Fe-2S domain-containing protein [Candidatus Thiodiazotropha sp.]|nr:Rieske 2Fe-2S domain-containing protein [Candidatus Thiodiazotropha sp.]MCM8884584.1 Rieske 2Fe-2S domain-containing protein [Candidatus Thiodiazotropha sp.]MCM8921746.1 Rieske 2Fe-2S domain-containing protein [Candidatus Thiodiazotropha sp.]MCU7872911.1 Rieske 2Fe-2S domain-containing protein [Candidatus Thiodiazotropha sp. (ex Lucinoma borealis)]